MKQYLLICLSLCLSSCVSKQTIAVQTWSEKDEAGLGLRVEWIKNKGDTLDTSMIITNRYPFEVIVPENSLQSAVDGAGTISQKTNRRLVLPANGQRIVIVPFEFSENNRLARTVTFSLDRAHKGEQTTQTVMETVGSKNTIANATVSPNRQSATGWAVTQVREHTNTYEALGFKEGLRLPSVKVVVPLNDRSPAKL